MTDEAQQTSAPLRRDVGTFGAMMMGMGSIVGTGVFVSIGLGAAVAGPSVLIAIALAAMVAICNGLSSAQLAANYPVSGGTYEYGYRLLSPTLGFTAGWMFLCAKSASAATAALGFAGYLLQATGGNTQLILPVALGALILLTLIVVTGIKRSNAINIVIVSVTLCSLIALIGYSFPVAMKGASEHLHLSWDSDSIPNLLYATALMFVAYTGYGRIATLGEEVQEPRRTIPRAVIFTLIVSMLLYMGVAFAGIGTIGAVAYGRAAQSEAAPLQVVAQALQAPWIVIALSIGAMTAMLGVLLNLTLGLSRVVLAMGRRGDAPSGVATINKQGVPQVATVVVALIIGSLVLIGNVKLTWTFSAFTVLIYYSITNLCAIRLPKEQRLFPIWPAWCGLAACIFLAFHVPWQIWLTGLSLLATGLIWHQVATRLVSQR